MVDATSGLRATLRIDRLWQFGAVGLLGAVFDFAVLIALHELAAVDEVVAKVIAAEVAILVMFAVNERWTFANWGADGHRSVLRRLATSNLVRTGGIVVSTAVLWALVTYAGTWYVYANVVGIAAGFFVNYAFENLLTWRTHR